MHTCTLDESGVLAALDHKPGSTAADLADHIGCEPGPLGVLLARLHLAGRVRRDGGRRGRWSLVGPRELAGQAHDYFDSLMRSNRSVV